MKYYAQISKLIGTLINMGRIRRWIRRLGIKVRRSRSIKEMDYSNPSWESWEDHLPDREIFLPVSFDIMLSSMSSPWGSFPLVRSQPDPQTTNQGGFFYITCDRIAHRDDRGSSEGHWAELLLPNMPNPMIWPDRSLSVERKNRH